MQIIVRLIKKTKKSSCNNPIPVTLSQFLKNPAMVKPNSKEEYLQIYIY